MIVPEATIEPEEVVRESCADVSCANEALALATVSWNAPVAGDVPPRNKAERGEGAGAGRRGDVVPYLTRT